jgi:CubicO group peptidase (beta-lactamase class C family)
VTHAVERPDSVGMSARRLERVRPAMQAYVDRGVYAGVSTLIARRGRIVHSEQFGWRDKEAQAPTPADTIFRLYSMTKPIVCVGLMTLLEEARCTLLDPLAKFVPAFGGVKVLEADGSLVHPARPVMLRDLMTHMSGLTYHFVDESPLGKMYQGSKLLDAKCPLEAAIDDLARFPLAFQPGSRWRYSVGVQGFPASAGTEQDKQPFHMHQLFTASILTVGLAFSYSGAADCQISRILGTG